MLKNILIASTVSFVNRYADRQSFVVSVYPLVVTMDTFRLDGAALTRLMHACETARRLASDTQQPGRSPPGPAPGARPHAQSSFPAQARPGLDSLLLSQQSRPLSLLSVYPGQPSSAPAAPPPISTFSSATGLNAFHLLRAACAAQPSASSRGPSDNGGDPLQVGKKRASAPSPPNLNDARAAATLTDLLRKDSSHPAPKAEAPADRPPLKRRRGREGYMGPSLGDRPPMPVPSGGASAYGTANAALQSALLSGASASAWGRDTSKGGLPRGPLSPPLSAHASGPTSLDPPSYNTNAPHLLQLRKGELVSLSTQARPDKPSLPTLLEALDASTTSRWRADAAGQRAGGGLASMGHSLSAAAEVLSGRFSPREGSKKPPAVDTGRMDGADAKPPANK